MVSETEVLEMFNKFPEVSERFKEHLKSQIKWYTLNGERFAYRTWLETIKIECEKYQDRKTVYMMYSGNEVVGNSDMFKRGSKC